MSEVVQCSVSVPLSTSEAFHLFFEELGRWWPREYTWSQEALQAIGIEPREGGLCFELGPYGFRCDWGRVLEWSPPDRVQLQWQISFRREPVPNPEKASLVEIGFTPEGAGSSRVTVTHSHFERHGAGAAEYQAAMASEHGWPYLLKRFSTAV